jgi:uncharacterized protein YndB with AHSA1/START domain
MSALRLERRVAQTPEQVFEAFDDPFRLRRWYGAPPGGVRLGQEGEGGVGIPVRVNLLDAKGAPLAQTIRLLSVQPGQSIWMELTWEGGDFGQEPSRVTLTVHPEEGGTRIEVHQEPISSLEAEEAYRAWWEANLERLARVVSGEAVPCFEEFWEESGGYVDPLGQAAHAILAGMREAGAAPETLASLEETLYAHLARLPEETTRVLGAVLRARLTGTPPTGG